MSEGLGALEWTLGKRHHREWGKRMDQAASLACKDPPQSGLSDHILDAVCVPQQPSTVEQGVLAAVEKGGPAGVLKAIRMEASLSLRVPLVQWEEGHQFCKADEEWMR